MDAMGQILVGTPTINVCRPVLEFYVLAKYGMARLDGYYAPIGAVTG